MQHHEVWLGSAPSAARIMPSQRHQDPVGFRYLRHLPNASSGASRAWSVQCGNAIPPGADLHPPRLDHRRRLCGSMRRHRLRLESWSLGCKSWVVLGVPSSSRILLYFWDKKGKACLSGECTVSQAVHSTITTTWAVGLQRKLSSACGVQRCNCAAQLTISLFADWAPSLQPPAVPRLLFLGSSPG